MPKGKYNHSKIRGKKRPDVIKRNKLRNQSGKSNGNVKRRI